MWKITLNLREENKRLKNTLPKREENSVLLKMGRF